MATVASIASTALSLRALGRERAALAVETRAREAEAAARADADLRLADADRVVNQFLTTTSDQLARIAGGQCSAVSSS